MLACFEVIAKIASKKVLGIKEEKKGTRIFKSVHCYSPTPPIRRRRPKKKLSYNRFY